MITIKLWILIGIYKIISAFRNLRIMKNKNDKIELFFYIMEMIDLFKDLIYLYT